VEMVLFSCYQSLVQRFHYSVSRFLRKKRWRMFS
jgi:hypothetical protein